MPFQSFQFVLHLFFFLFSYFSLRFILSLLFRFLFVLVFSPPLDSPYSCFIFTFLFISCIFSMVITLNQLISLSTFYFRQPLFKNLNELLPFLSFFLNISFFTIYFFLLSRGGFYLWLIELFLFTLLFCFVYFINIKIAKVWLSSNSFNIIFYFFVLLSSLIICYFVLPGQPLLAMEASRVEGDCKYVEAWEWNSTRLVKAPYTLPERNIDLSTPSISYYADPESLPSPHRHVTLYPTNSLNLTPSSSLVPLLHVVDTPLTVSSSLPKHVSESWSDLFVIYRDGKDGSILALHKWTPRLYSYYNDFNSGNLPTVYTFNSSLLSSYPIDYLELGKEYFYSDTHWWGRPYYLDDVVQIKHRVSKFWAMPNSYDLRSILSYMTPSTSMRDSFISNHFLSSLSTSSSLSSPIKSDYVYWVSSYPNKYPHAYLTSHLISNIVMVNPDSWVTTTPPKCSGCAPCLGSSRSSPSLVLPFTKKEALSSHFFCKNFIFICSCCRTWVPTLSSIHRIYYKKKV